MWIFLDFTQDSFYRFLSAWIFKRFITESMDECYKMIFVRILGRISARICRKICQMSKFCYKCGIFWDLRMPINEDIRKKLQGFKCWFSKVFLTRVFSKIFRFFLEFLKGVIVNNIPGLLEILIVFKDC